MARGYDVTHYTLQCFGGAGGQHACLVADALGMRRIFCHPLAGVLSAYGMGLADQAALREASLECILDAAGIAAARVLAARLCTEARDELQAQGVAPESIRASTQVRVRYQGTDTALACELSAAAEHETVRAEFERHYRQRFAFLMPQLDLVIEAVAVECSAEGESAPGGDVTEIPPSYEPEAAAELQLYCFADEAPAGRRAAKLYDRVGLRPGAAIDGPSIIVDATATTVVEPGWRAVVTTTDNLELTRVRAAVTAGAAATDADPVMLEIFNNVFMNIAEQMGLALQNTAHSVNIKERLDFSCAVFDQAGALIANAPHMPVHLGSMGESVRTVMQRNPRMRRGDVYALNDPYHGGTHLPDVTVVTPVFLERERQQGRCEPQLDRMEAAPAFFVASRGHHADIGGITPGSMPPFSVSIEEEGVLIDNFKLVEGGTFREADLLALLNGGPHPARNPRQNLADLRAQIAAERRAGTAALGGAVRPRYRCPLYAARPGQRRRMRAPGDHGAGRWPVYVDAGQWRPHPAERARRPGPAQRLHRFQRHQRADAEQLQRAARDHGGGRLVRVSYAGGR